ncbi:MAG: Lrp/AsnC family transcriptional regulator [Candidatus Thorarchaeota archaeon]
MPKKKKLDDLDYKILRELQKECRTSLQDIANVVGAPTSTVHYRVKRLEKNGVIEGYYAKINSEKVDLDYLTLIAITTEYGQNYYDKIGKEMAKVDGVWSVYYTLGEYDFYVLTRSRNREEYMKILDALMCIEGMERTRTQMIAKVIKEDPRLHI